MNSVPKSKPSSGSAMMRLRLRLYPHRRYFKWLRQVARWQMRLPFADATQWRFCRWVSRLTTDPGERVLWRMPGTTLHFMLDPLETIQMSLYYRAGFQPEIGRWIKQSLKPNALFIDCGANIGIQSLIAAEYYRAQLGVATEPMVYAFEPNPRILRQLEENIRLNQLENFIKAQPNAVADREAWTRFYLSSEDNSTSSSLADLGPSNLHTGEAIEVQTVSLAEFVQHHSINRRVGLIKLDIEGAELLALRGAQAILVRDHPTIIMEVYPAFMRAFGYTFADVFQFLTPLGYMIYRIQPNGELAKLAKGEWPAEIAYGDIICFAEKNA